MPFKTGGNGEPQLSADSAQLTQALHGRHYEDALAGQGILPHADASGISNPYLHRHSVGRGYAHLEPRQLQHQC